MKLLFKIKTFFIFILVLSGSSAVCAGEGALFDFVPPGDPTYHQLKQLEATGLLKKGASGNTLTRFEVAKLILSAEAKYGEIVVAQADIDLPPPPEFRAEYEKDAAEPTVNSRTARARLTPLPTPDESPGFLDRAAKILHSLEEAYDYEVKVVKYRVKAAQYEAAGIDKEQYDLLKRLNGISQYPSISIHGLGRAFGFSQVYSGDFPVSIVNPSYRGTVGYLDLEPQAVVSREVGWNAMIRVGSGLQPNTALDSLTLRRVTLEFDPDWMSATLGDFYEAYTPLTLWNRNSLDLKYMPEMIQRFDEIQKYEQFLDQEPSLPFRGVRLETALKWPDSDVVDQAKISAFIHMIRNGFNDVNPGTTYYGPYQFTDWIFAGTGSVNLRKWYLGGTSLQLSVDAYGIILDEPLSTDTPGSPYGPFDPATWAHQYQIGSVKPSLRFGFGNDLYLGAGMETATMLYEDDKLDPAMNTRDYAAMGGPFMQFGDSRVAFNYLRVGPYYYSPLAQTRQDALLGPSASPFIPGTTGMFAPDLFYPPVRSEYFLSNVPRPGAIYGYYDRTQDNTFPYGLGTPNRRGGGLELDLKTLKQDSLKIAGSAYLVQEIVGNYVVNTTGSALVPLDAPQGLTAPIRNFTYINIGPSFNLGSYFGWKYELEVGTNFRYEQTSSSIGILTSNWILGGVKVGLLSFWDFCAAYGSQAINGSDAGLNGTLWARYSYVLDGTDLGQYSVFKVNGRVQSLRLSNDFNLGNHSRILMDYDLTGGNILPYAPSLAGNFFNQYMEVTYEIQF